MKVDIAILTIREDEFTAVRRRFQTERRRIPHGRTYLIGEVKTEKQTYIIAIARCSEQGMDASQRLAHHIIHNLDPQLILVVGVAGGVPHDEFSLGDVVISTRIINPNVDAWHPDGTTNYTTRGGPPHPLVENIISLLPGEPQLACWTDTIQLKRPTLDPAQANITGDDEWREQVRKSLNWHFGEEHNRNRQPTFTIGHILSSNHLIKDPARLKEILKTHRSILAVEMEVAGVYEAAQDIDHQYPVMAIRGISDIVGLQRDSKWTEYACQTAAAFTYAFIMTDPLDPPLNSAGFQKTVAPSEISSELSLDPQHSKWHIQFDLPEGEMSDDAQALLATLLLRMEPTKFPSSQQDNRKSQQPLKLAEKQLVGIVGKLNSEQLFLLLVSYLRVEYTIAERTQKLFNIQADIQPADIKSAINALYMIEDCLRKVCVLLNYGSHLLKKISLETVPQFTVEADIIIEKISAFRRYLVEEKDKFPYNAKINSNFRGKFAEILSNLDKFQSKFTG